MLGRHFLDRLCLSFLVLGNFPLLQDFSLSCLCCLLLTDDHEYDKCDADEGSHQTTLKAKGTTGNKWSVSRGAEQTGCDSVAGNLSTKQEALGEVPQSVGKSYEPRGTGAYVSQGEYHAGDERELAEAACQD